MRRVLALALAALLSPPALAVAQPCAGYPQATPLPLPPSRETPGVSRLWGGANLAPVPGGVAVAYPAGSINPGNPAAPQGGAGFLWRAGAPAEARCLTYRLRFEPGFAFARGGKLPGLYGGDAPSGCTPAELSRGFSARLMWREGGDGELYLYAPDRSVRCGESIGRGSFRLVPGQQHEIAQEVVLNRPGAADGRIRIWLDGRLALDRGGLVLRSDPAVRVEGLMFSTFFGGADPSWASPRGQSAAFTGIALRDATASR